MLGWADPDGDYDAIVLVTAERFRSTPPEATLVWLYAEGDAPRRLIGDFSIVSDETLEEALRSARHRPLAFVDAAVIADRTGTLVQRCRALAAFPEEDGATGRSTAISRWGSRSTTRSPTSAADSPRTAR